MKHYLKQINKDTLSFYKFIDDETGDEIGVNTAQDIETHRWVSYAPERVSGLFKDGYVQSSKEEFTEAYIASITKLNKITLEF